MAGTHCFMGEGAYSDEMAKICFVVTRIRKPAFTGGILCVLQHAHYLALKGHEVTVVTLQPSDAPDWYQGCEAGFYLRGVWP